MEGGEPVKKLLTSFFLLIFIIGILSGLDFGGSINNKSIISYSYLEEELSDYSETGLSLWLTADLSDTIKLMSQGSYTYSTVKPYLFELDFLNIGSETESLFSYTVGRLWAADFSGHIFSHTLDGVTAELNFPTAILSMTAGYSGLLFTDSSTVVISKADQSDQSSSEVIFAAPRLISGLDLLLPELFMSQDLNLSFWMQMDLRAESDLLSEGPQAESSKGGKLHTQYSGIGLKGALAPSLYYDTNFFLGTGKTLSYIDAAYSYENILSFMGTFGLRYYLQDKFFSKAGFKFIYSSGDSDYSEFTEGNTESNSTNFIPVSRSEFAQIFSPLLGNIFIAQLNYSIKPFGSGKNKKLQNIQTELKASGFFRSTTGKISEPGINQFSDSLYLGTEIDAVINFRPFSDLGIALSGGVFLPDTSSSGAFLETERNVELTGKAEFSFSF